MKFYVDKDEMYPVYSLQEGDILSGSPVIELTIPEYAQYIAAETAYYKIQRIIEAKLIEAVQEGKL